jgi:hypothetical protein
MLQAPGPGLDLEVARRLGDESAPAPPYSTDPETTDCLIRRLEEKGLSVTCEQAGPIWHCALAALIYRSRERLATGAGPNRAVAVCRAIANLPSRSFSSGAR